jgi:hypothetical protein
MDISRRKFIHSLAASVALSQAGLSIRMARALMIEPISAAEQLMYSTVRIDCPIPNTDKSKTGTGFFYDVPTADAGVNVPILVTNKHVIEGTPSANFVVHSATQSGAKKPDSNRNFTSPTSAWIPHPKTEIDLCALPVAEITNSTSPYPFLRTINPGHTRSQAELEQLNAVEDVLMVGYPIGLWDAANNFPIIRRGITASHPAVDFDVKGVATTVVDIAAFPGSSGSPVFIYNNGAIIDKKNNTTFGTRLIFLGVLYSGPTFQPDGKIAIKDVPTVATAVPVIDTMINLGYLIKAKEVIALGEHILTTHNLKPK